MPTLTALAAPFPNNTTDRSLPVAGQIFSDTRCRGFSLARWMRQRSSEEARALVRDALQAATEGQLRLDDTREFPFSDALTAIEAARTPGGPVVFT